MATTLNSTGITFPDGSTDSTDPLLSIAASSVGAVGTYALCRYYGGSVTTVAGGTIAGSSIYYSNAYGGNWYCYAGVSPPGSWRAMGYCRNNGSPDAITVWLRYV